MLALSALLSHCLSATDLWLVTTYITNQRWINACSWSMINILHRITLNIPDSVPDIHTWYWYRMHDIHAVYPSNMHAYMFSIYDISGAINALQVYTIRLLACSYMLAYNHCTMHSMHCINVCYIMSMIDDVHPTVLYCIVAIRCMLSVSVTNSLYYQ